MAHRNQFNARQFVELVLMTPKVRILFIQELFEHFYTKGMLLKDQKTEKMTMPWSVVARVVASETRGPSFKIH